MGYSDPAGVGDRTSLLAQVQMTRPPESAATGLPTPDLARECAAQGVKAIQLVGWNVGGQDQNNPSHDPDPLLGGPEELRTAIAASQALGVKIILFTKFVWADRATERFRGELSRWAVKDPYGDYYVNPGYRYQTVTQLLDIDTKRLVPMCFCAPGWIEICKTELAKVLSSGADGMLYDECHHHMPALACFDPGHGHRYGQPVYANDVDSSTGSGRSPDQVRPDFLYAGEACTDWQFSAYHFSYHRSESPSTSPDALPAPRRAVDDGRTGFDDRNMVNQCLLYRYIISYEPYNFKGRLADMPLTVAYGQKMDAMRTELRQWLWDGEFQGTTGARVSDRSSGQEHMPYSVFKSRADGSLAVVVANYSGEDRVVDVVLAGQDGGRYRLVEGGDWSGAAGGVPLPARSAAVVIELRPPPIRAPRGN